MALSGMRYIAIDGPIGAGKTTLARRLAATLEARLLLEAPDDNPFLGPFYDNPRGHALAAQLAFLLQRSRQLDALRQTDLFASRHVADFLFDKDRLFASLTLDGAELSLYEQIDRRLMGAAPVPDRVIYLDAPADVLMRRIEWRGRPQERALARDYLERVASAYRDFFARYTAAPVVAVDAAELDLAGSERDYEGLLQALRQGAARVNLGGASML